MKKLKPLAPSTKKLRAAILKDFSHDAAFIAVLDAGLMALDLFHASQIRVDAEGLTVTGDRGNLKVHPLLDVVKSARAQWFAACKLLHLDLPEEDSQRGPGRPTSAEAWRKS